MMKTYEIIYEVKGYVKVLARASSSYEAIEVTNEYMDNVFDPGEMESVEWDIVEVEEDD